jgi:hypothetical protein
MSDEFSSPNRSFSDGFDPIWTALHKNDYTNAALHYYHPRNVFTNDRGQLEIVARESENTFVASDKKDSSRRVSETKHYETGMVQSWNKFCFTGGIVEIDLQLPGDAYTGGLWPAAWLLGNLARATYVGSSDFQWPWSYDTCDPLAQVSQELSSCNKAAHWGMRGGEGRGAPEIDIVEAMPGAATKLPHTTVKKPYASSSYQVAPGIREGRPSPGSLPDPKHWYTGMTYGLNTSLNPFFYGVTLEHTPESYTYQSDAISANTGLGSSHFEEMHTFRVEWEPPKKANVNRANVNRTDEDKSDLGYIRWYMDGEFMYGIEGSSLNITGSTIPDEPMYIILNTAISSTWGFPAPMPDGCKCKSYKCGDPDCKCAFPPGFCDNFPASFLIDHVRVYQAPDHIQACSTADKPTHLFIEGHKERYSNADFPDEPMLRSVDDGGAACTRDDQCGHGVCGSSKKCDCTNGGGTGPTCRAWKSFYDASVYQNLGIEEKLSVQGVYVSKGLVVGLIIVLALFVYQWLKRVRERQEQLEQYQYVQTYGGSISSMDDAYGAGTPVKMGVGVGSAQSRSPSHGSYYQRGSGNAV